MVFDPKSADDCIGRLSSCEAANAEVAILLRTVIDRLFYDSAANEHHDVSDRHCHRSAMHNRATRKNPGVRDT
jgi:hypothetical protein